MRPFWFGARLALRRRSAARVSTVVTSIAIAIGVALLLVVAAVPDALARRSDRAIGRVAAMSQDAAAPLLVANTIDVWRDEQIIRVYLATVRDGEPAPPPGVERIPEAGEVVVSPKLAELMAGGDGAGLRGRVPGRQIGTVADAGLLDADELIAYIGVAPEAMPVGDLTLRSSSGFGGGAYAVDADAGDPAETAALSAALVAALLAALLAVLIAASTRLATNVRAGRVAALRLAGASRRQSRLVIAGDVAVSGVIGTVLGGIVFWLLRSGPAAWWWPAPWFPADLQFGISTIVVLAIMPLFTQLVAQIASRTALSDPLARRRRRGISLRRGLRVLSFVVAMLLLAVAALEPGALPRALRSQMMIVAVVVLLVTIPLVMPVLLEAFARATGRWARSVRLQLALRRLQHDPTAAARAVSIVAIALVVSAAIAGIFTQTNIAAEDRAQLEAGNGRFLGVELLGADGAARLVQDLGSVGGIEAAVAYDEVRVQQAAVEAPSTPGPPPLRFTLWVGSCEGIEGVLGTGGSCDARPSFRFVRTNDAGKIDRGCVDRCLEEGLPLALAPASTSNAPAPSAPITVPGDPVAVAPGPEVTLPIEVRQRITGGIPDAWLDAADMTGVAPNAPQRVLIRTDGSTDAEDAVRDAAYAVSPTARVNSLAGETARHESMDGAGRQLRDLGVAMALVLALGVFTVTGADALLDRRALTGASLAMGQPARSLAGANAGYLVIPLIISIAIGLVIGELFAAVMSRYFGHGVVLRPDLVALAIATLVVGATVSRVAAGYVVHRARAADAIRRE